MRWQQAVDSCNYALSRGWAYPCATKFAELMGAEAVKVIPSDWRAYVDADRVNDLIRNNPASLRASWNRDCDKLTTLLEYGGTLIYEEAMHALTVRSEIQLGAQFIAETNSVQLFAELDALLSRAMKRNPTPFKECQDRCKCNLSSQLPDHWWWVETKTVEKSYG